jgi:hypothetical protein
MHARGARPMRRGGRKQIVAPDGSELAPATEPQPNGALVKALARAWRWQRMLDEGVYTSASEIGGAAGQDFYNTSKFTLRDLRARRFQQQLRTDFEAI